MSPEQTLDLSNQCSHVGCFGLLTMILALWLRPWQAALVALGVVLVKEFVIDPLWEGDTIVNGFWDTLWSSVGIGLALGMHRLRDFLRAHPLSARHR